MSPLSKFVIIALAIAVLASCLAAPAAMAASKPRIIIAPITDKTAPDPGRQKTDNAAEVIRSGLKDALFKSNKYEIVADADLQKELDSARWAQYASGEFDPALAAEIGRKVGAQQLVKCNVVVNQYWVERKDILGIVKIEEIAKFAVSVEMCDITKATICFMHTAESQKNNKATVLTGDPGTKPLVFGNTKDVRAQAVADVVQQLVDAITKDPGAGAVLEVKDKTIVVSIGSNAGAEKGGKLSILGKDEFGFEEEIGTAEIAATMPDKSKATVTTSSRAIAKGDVVRLAGSSSASASGSTGSTSATTIPGGDSSKPETVTVVTASGEGASKESAINAALLQAIQMVGGLYIMCEQEAENYRMVKNQMFSKTDGFVTKYEEVSSSKGDDGTITATVKAWVSSRPVYDSLRAKQVLARQRVMVCVPETHLRLVVPDPAGETEIIKRLLEKNFVVVDQKISEQIKKDDVNRQLIATGDADKVIALLSGKRSAEILICGEAFSAGAQRQNTDAGPKFVSEARIEVRAINLDTAQILWTDGVHATGVGATEEVSGKQALKNAARLLCAGSDGEKGFVDRLLERVVDSADTSHNVQCQVSGVKSADDVVAVEEGLRQAVGDRPVYRYSFQNGLAILNVESPKTAQDLADSIGRLTMKGKLSVTASSANRLELVYTN